MSDNNKNYYEQALSIPLSRCRNRDFFFSLEFPIQAELRFIYQEDPVIEGYYNEVKAGTSSTGQCLSGWPLADEKGNPIKKHWKNTEHLCKSMGIIFRYNEMSKCVEVNHPRFDGLTFDGVVTEMMGVCAEKGYSITKADLIDHVGRISEENKYSPVREYLQECMRGWDGKTRLDQLFNTLILDPDSEQDKKLLLALLEKWLISCVKMAFNDGTEAAQGVLVLVGPQGIGKTRWLFSILPSREWGKEAATLDPTLKDDVIKALSYWIVELGEIGSSLKREKLDKLKAFITESNDAIRMPYGRAMEKRPRTTCFLGTVDNKMFLKDDAGERRYWIIQIVDVNADHKLDLDQLWGEITYLAITEKRPHWLTRDEIQNLNSQNEVYKVMTPEEQILLDSLDWNSEKKDWVKLTVTDICNLLDIPSNRNVLVGKALQRLSRLGVICPTNNRDKRYHIPKFKNGFIQSQARQIYLGVPAAGLTKSGTGLG